MLSLGGDDVVSGPYDLVTSLAVSVKLSVHFCRLHGKRRDYTLVKVILVKSASHLSP